MQPHMAAITQEHEIVDVRLASPRCFPRKHMMRHTQVMMGAALHTPAITNNQRPNLRRSGMPMFSPLPQHLAGPVEHDTNKL